jgi:SP family facilitated glucose transporter-like MFS transporter 1
LNEISPVSLRGKVGCFQQLGFTGGVLFAQIIGMRQILGTESLWHFLVAGPLLIAVMANLVAYFYLPDTPYELIQVNFKRTERGNLLLKTRFYLEKKIEAIEL